MVWTRLSLPKHAFITRIIVNHRLPTKKRVQKFIQIDPFCELCKVFFQGPYTMQIWDCISQWLPAINPHNSLEETLVALSQAKGTQAHRTITDAVFSAMVYHIWKARN